MTPAIETPAERHRAIIRDVLTKHGMTHDELIGDSRYRAFYLARVEVAKALQAAGVKPLRIAKILNKDHSTVNYYLDPDRRGDRMRRDIVQRGLPAEVVQHIAATAKARRITKAEVVRQWVLERAQVEMAAPAKVAA